MAKWEDENGCSQHTKIRTKIDKKVEGQENGRQAY